mgnify:CR=1 FL=1
MVELRSVLGCRVPLYEFCYIYKYWGRGLTLRFFFFGKRGTYHIVSYLSNWGHTSNCVSHFSNWGHFSNCVSHFSNWGHSSNCVSHFSNCVSDCSKCGVFFELWGHLFEKKGGGFTFSNGVPLLEPVGEGGTLTESGNIVGRL